MEMTNTLVTQLIRHKIYDIRGERVMLDFDLAHLYDVETKVLNQAVKRNISRFPDDFMFRLSKAEWTAMRSQMVTLGGQNEIEPTPDKDFQRSQIVTFGGTNTKYLPYAFTEQGVAMLSGVLKSDRAIQMNIAIMRAFVEIRRILIQKKLRTNKRIIYF
jgi:hypothetical protein